MSTPQPLEDLPPALTDAPDAVDHLFPILYEELRRMAHQRLRHERAGHTLSTTGLVHEAYLKLAGQTRAHWRDRGHFLAVAAQAMRRVLVDHARRQGAARRGGGAVQVDLDAVNLAVDEQAETLVALDVALTRLAALDPRMCRVVECRFFAGLSDQETAEVLDVAPRTVWRDWVKAKGWLYRELYG